MKKVQAFVAAGLLFLPQAAWSQGADCNALARDLVIKSFQSNSSDYSKLLFLSSLTQMDEKTAKEALDHSGRVSVGPINIGPGTWNKEKQEKLRSELQKIVNIEQLRRSAASISVSSGDANVAKVVSDCLNAGGFHVVLEDFGKETAVVQLMWNSFPGMQAAPTTIDSVTVVNGKIIGGSEYAERGARLNDRMRQRITIQRNPKEGLAVIVNATNGSDAAYLPPSELPPPPPPKIVRTAIEAKVQATITSGGGGSGPFCQRRSVVSCVEPQHGGKIVIGSGRPKIIYRNEGDGRAFWENPNETPERYCVTFWANTGACETEIKIIGVATATEEYAEATDF